MNRAAFEAWVCSPECQIYRGAVWRLLGVKWDATTGRYLSHDVQLAWSAWQAAEAETARRCVEIAKDYYRSADARKFIVGAFPEAFK